MDQGEYKKLNWYRAFSKKDEKIFLKKESHYI